MQRPKGMPRKEWSSLSDKEKRKAKARFLDFNIQTTSVNSGSQQYGAGLTMTGGKAQSAHSGTIQKSKGGSVARSIMLKPKKTRTVQPGMVNGNFPIISETEMIGTVVVPDSGYNVTNDFIVQPALPIDEQGRPGGSCFRFIVPMAQLYEKYELLDFKITYKPLVSVFSDGGKAGQVVLSYTFDSLTGAPADIIQALATQPHVEGMGNQALTLRVDCREAMIGGKYTRNAVVPSADQKTYDAGRIFVCVDGVPVTAGTIGQLIVSYTIRLLNPRPGGIVIAPPNYQFSSYVREGLLAFSGSATWSNPTGPWTFNNFTTNPLNIQPVAGPAGANGPSFRLPPGCWYTVWRVRSSNTGSTTAIALSVSASSDAGVTWASSNTDEGGAYINVPAAYVSTEVTKLVHSDGRFCIACAGGFINAVATGSQSFLFQVYISAV